MEAKKPPFGSRTHWQSRLIITTSLVQTNIKKISEKEEGKTLSGYVLKPRLLMLLR